MVTHFLQSVFPYDEYRDWEGDAKHLPFIHNRDIASQDGSRGRGSPPYSPPARGGGDEEALRLLLRAKVSTAVLVCLVCTGRVVPMR